MRRASTRTLLHRTQSGNSIQRQMASLRCVAAAACLSSPSAPVHALTLYAAPLLFPPIWMTVLFDMADPTQLSSASALLLLPLPLVCLALSCCAADARLLFLLDPLIQQRTLHACWMRACAM
jgi:hypothetical protein